MKDQHTKIKGYRDLTAEEIDLMNKVKAHGEATEQLLAEVRAHLARQGNAADADEHELNRIGYAEPARWLAMARSDLQTGTMKLVRAIAQPTSF